MRTGASANFGIVTNGWLGRRGKGLKKSKCKSLARTAPPGPAKPQAKRNNTSIQEFFLQSIMIPAISRN